MVGFLNSKRFTGRLKWEKPTTRLSFLRTVHAQKWQSGCGFFIIYPILTLILMYSACEKKTSVFLCFWSLILHACHCKSWPGHRKNKGGSHKEEKHTLGISKPDKTISSNLTHLSSYLTFFFFFFSELSATPQGLLPAVNTGSGVIWEDVKWQPSQFQFFLMKKAKCGRKLQKNLDLDLVDL